MVATLLSYNNTQDWSLGLRFVQNQKNSAYQAGLKCTPYSAMFGCGPKVGLKSKNLLQEIIEQLETRSTLQTFSYTSTANSDHSYQH